jgi:ATP-dependent Clp protease protease subunit
MAAVLKIYGDIGESLPESFMGEGSDTISAKIVSEFLDENKDATDITVRINSRGGDVQEGWAIYDLLTNSGKKIKTIGESKVYSIATIVFLAGTEREMMKNADGLIHNPFIPPYTLADKYESGDLVRLAESLKQEEEKILEFYAEKTGADKSRLAEYMKEDTKLSAEDMLSLGFATKVIEPVVAYAYIKRKNNFKMDEKAFFEKLGSTLDSAIAKIGNFSRIKDQTLKDKDGNEFKLEKESGAPAVGDKAAPDGTFTMTDGKTIVITGGVVTEVKEPTAAKTELELANEKIAELEAKVALAETAKAEAETAKTEAQVAKEEAEKVKVAAQSIVTELTNLKNSWVPTSRQKNFGNLEKVGDVDLTKAKEIGEKIKSKKE